MSLRAWTTPDARVLLLTALSLVVGCASNDKVTRPDEPAAPSGGNGDDAGAVDDAGPGDDGGVGGSGPVVPTLSGPPLLFAPTTHGFGLSALTGAGDPALLRARVRKA